MYNIYDFDKTIYDGDSTIDFYFFCLKQKVKIIKYFPRQILGMLKYKIKIIPKEKFKEEFLSFIKEFDSLDLIVINFWKKNNKKIKKWYLIKDHSKDIIISASPEFLLKPIAEELLVYDLLASIVDKTNGNFKSLNCYGEEKVKRLREKYGNNVKVKECYSDSLSDLPLFKIAKEPFLVKKNNIIRFLGDDK